jgi:hypothetical protein
MIRGDIYDFSKREYKQPGNPTISYPKADGYSNELRASVKELLTAWGFENITFVLPKENSYDRHTIIRGNHKSPSVNIGYKQSPKTDRILCFDNKYGVVHLSLRQHDSDEKDHWRQWSNTESAINGYLQRAGIIPNYLGNVDKIITLPNRETLREAATAGLLESRKADIRSHIFSHAYKIKDYQWKIANEKKEIENLKTKYKQDFGEDVPEQKVSS